MVGDRDAAEAGAGHAAASVQLESASTGQRLATTANPSDRQPALNRSFRWIPPNRLSGRWQMAIDAWLLDQVVTAARLAAAAAPVLRVYRWSRPTLSLGYHQAILEPEWWRLVRHQNLEVVRRPSGGRAVLHGFDLTYALIWPDPPRRRREAYARTCAWLQACFAELGLPLHRGSEAPRSPAPSCFSSATEADLIHGDGSKRIGSAQVWRHGVLLQHGSIQLNPPDDLWREVFGEERPALQPLPLPTEALIDLLRRQALSHLPMVSGLELRDRDLSSDELVAIAGQLSRYDLSGRAGATTSPVDTIDRAT